MDIEGKQVAGEPDSSEEEERERQDMRWDQNYFSLVKEAGLQILYIWATWLRAKKCLGAKNPRIRGKQSRKGEKRKKDEGESYKKREWKKLKRVVKKKKKPENIRGQEKRVPSDFFGLVIKVWT